MSERIALGGTGWRVWPDAVLRSTGFPAEGLDLLRAPECAAAADRLLDTPHESAPYEKAFEEADRAGAAALSGLAADPLLREAITWQNRDFAAYLDTLRDGDPGDRRRSRRVKERTLVRYWQRYCGKNETVGFFGPVLWVRLEPHQAERVRISTGPGLVRHREVHLERWCVDAYAARLAEDPQTRWWLAPTVAAHVHLDGRQALLPGRPPVRLGPAEVAALRLCDGSRPAIVVAQELLADGSLSLRTLTDAELLLDRLAERELLDRGGQVPVATGTERLLAERLNAIGDPDVRLKASAGLDRILAARDRVALAAGDAGRLTAALSELDDCVGAELGGPARQRAGDMYAGRTPCYEETVRDIDVTFGTALLDDLAAPLGIVLLAARWVTVALAEAYRAALEELVEDPAMRLGDLMYLAQGLFWTGDDRPVDAVAAEFARRWSALFPVPPKERRIEQTAAELSERAVRLFPADRPGWTAAATHSPDLQICASSAEAVNRGDYLAVLGEMHAARSTLEFFVPWHPQPDRMWSEIEADSGGAGRLRPLYPTGWPRHTGRVSMSPGPYGRRLGFVAAPRPEEGEVLPAMAVRLERRHDGAVEAVEPDGRRWPIIEVFSEWLSVHAVDAFKLPAATEHQPRITVDRLVVARETWRTTVDGTGLAGVKGGADRFLAARRLRRRLGLPDRVFVKIGTEVKPCYADLTSPQSVGTLATMLRSAARSAGPAVPVTISEALPVPADAWLPDAAGRRYFCELRLQVTEHNI